MSLQGWRFWTRVGFFALFLLAPPLDLFRLDLTQRHFVLLGRPWTLGLDPFIEGRVGEAEAALNLLVRGLLPFGLLVGGGIWVSWRYGRVYCGWLCPHFSVVETINALMRRASGRPTLWERDRRGERRFRPQGAYWSTVGLGVGGFAFLWALTLLTYLYPPPLVYAGLLHGTLGRGEALFLTVGTLAFATEFLLARHLFCRFGCAVGLFQSLAWMANKRAMVVGLERSRLVACVRCTAACDDACPMRLKPRTIKRQMFACTQCGRCIDACHDVLGGNGLLTWRSGEAALDVSDRDFGRRPDRGKDSVERSLNVSLQPSART